MKIFVFNVVIIANFVSLIHQIIINLNALIVLKIIIYIMEHVTKYVQMVPFLIIKIFQGFVKIVQAYAKYVIMVAYAYNVNKTQ